MTTVSDIEKKQVLFLQVVFSLRLELKAFKFPFSFPTPVLEYYTLYLTITCILNSTYPFKILKYNVKTHKYSRIFYTVWH
jgi:hypothetical protein